MVPSKLITRAQVAERLGLSLIALDTLLLRKRRGDTTVTVPLPTVYLGPRSPRWLEADIEKYLNERTPA